MLSQGLKSLPAQQPQLSTNRQSDLHDSGESADKSNTYSEEL
jgi:hypothetical protein